MIKRTISLYQIEDFRVYESLQLALGKRLRTITYYAKPEQINTLVPFVDIVDLSAYLGLDGITQSLLEQLIQLFPLGVELIADIKYEQKAREILRFVINDIHYIDVGNNEKKKQVDTSLRDTIRIIDLKPDELDSFYTQFN